MYQQDLDFHPCPAEHQKAGAYFACHVFSISDNFQGANRRNEEYGGFVLKQVEKITFNNMEENEKKKEPVDINAASEQELAEIPGIGNERAKEIVEYREENGEFKNWDDVKKIPGFSDELVDRLKREGVTMNEENEEDEEDDDDGIDEEE
jgi:comEA protein